MSKTGTPLRMGRWTCECGRQEVYSNYCPRCDTNRPKKLPLMTNDERKKVLATLTDEQLEALSVDLTGDQQRILISDGRRMASLMSDFVNSMDEEPAKEAAELLSRTHCTLQQNFMRFCLAFIEHMANKPYTDLRNEASAKLARTIIVEIPDSERYLPSV